MASKGVNLEGVTVAVIYMIPVVESGKEIVRIYSSNCGDTRSILVFVPFEKIFPNYSSTFFCLFYSF